MNHYLLPPSSYRYQQFFSYSSFYEHLVDINLYIPTYISLITIPIFYITFSYFINYQIEPKLNLDITLPNSWTLMLFFSNLIKTRNLSNYIYWEIF